MDSVVTDIIRILVSGITNLGQGIASGLASTVQALFLTGEGTQASPYALSTFGGVVVVFAAIALAVGLTTMITKWVMSLGARK